MDDKNSDPNNKSANPRKNASHDDVPLWLQGLAKRVENEETDKHHADEWIKEIPSSETVDENINQLSPDEGDLEGALPDWISELPVEEPEVEFNPVESLTTDDLQVENEIPDKKEVDRFENFMTEEPHVFSETQDFLEISNLASSGKSENEPSWKNEIQDEEELPDWLKEMINEHGESLTGDTEPVEIHNKHVQEPEGILSIDEEERINDWSQEDTSPYDFEFGEDNQEKTDIQPELPSTEPTNGELYEDQLADITDEEIKDNQFKEVSTETTQDVTLDDSLDDFNEDNIEDSQFKEIDNYQSEPDAVEGSDFIIREEVEEEEKEEIDIEFMEIPVELTPHTENEESLIEEISTPIEEVNGEYSNFNELDESVNLSELELQTESTMEKSTDEISPDDLEKPFSLDENGDNDELNHDKWLSELADVVGSKEDKITEGGLPPFLENRKRELEENEEFDVGDEVPEYLQTVDPKSDFIIDQDTSPTPTINLDDVNDKSSNDDEESKYIPKVLEKAKKYLEQGDMNKGLDIIDVYIDENSYLDEIQGWLENLASHPENLNQRLLTSLGDLALKQGHPQKAYENYAQAMKNLIQN